MQRRVIGLALIVIESVGNGGMVTGDGLRDAVGVKGMQGQPDVIELGMFSDMVQFFVQGFEEPGRFEDQLAAQDRIREVAIDGEGQSIDRQAEEAAGVPFGIEQQRGVALIEDVSGQRFAVKEIVAGVSRPVLPTAFGQGHGQTILGRGRPAFSLFIFERGAEVGDEIVQARGGAGPGSATVRNRVGHERVSFVLSHRSG